MERSLPAVLRSLFLAIVLVLSHTHTYATHIVGAELRYRWISGLTYEVTVFLYGDCGPASAGAFAGLPTSRPSVCIINGDPTLPAHSSTLTMNLPIPSAGTEVTPVCPDSLGFTQCTSTSYSIPGIKKFVYSNTVTLPFASPCWRFIYNGSNGAVGSSGRAAVITNIDVGGGGNLIQLIDTLNNSATNTRGHNSSPVLTVEPVPFFCASALSCYNPGAVDLHDVSPTEPAGDSLSFNLISPTNGTGNCASVGGPATYVGRQCPGGPLNDGPHPLYNIDCTPASFNFDQNTGQLCFVPLIQRSVVVYNVREFRNDTVSITPLIVNKVLVGTLQREMTFRVQTCTYTTPVGKIDSFSGPGDTLSGTRFRSCANSGSFNVYINPNEPDTSLHISVTATGLSVGFTYVVTGDGTSSPHVTLTGNTSVIIPGTYIIYLTFTDNHCPIVGTKTYAFTFEILPVPTISRTIVEPATCDQKAYVRFDPGGTGKPWTIKLSYNPPAIFPTPDTFRVFPPDTSSVYDSLVPGYYHMTIFTATSNDCHVSDTFSVPTPLFDLTGSKVDPTYCGAKDGRIILGSLNPGKADSVRYNYQGIPQPAIGFVVTPDGTDTLYNLLAGTYTNIVVKEGYCETNPFGPLVLVNPPFTWRTVTTKDVTRCGFCNGIDTLFGLHPDQLDTITYDFQNWGLGTPVPQTASAYINADSMVILSGLCAGHYSNFTVKTAGVCSFTVPGTFDIDSPSIFAGFDSLIHYGCHGDTLVFENESFAESPLDSNLTFKWFFGDGATDTAKHPTHIYTNTNGASYTVKLYITNSRCIDSSVSVILLDNHVNANFDFTPNPYVCQDSIVGFTSTSTGNNLTYAWDFDDGGNSTIGNPTHSFKNTGQYNVRLIAANHLIPLPNNGSTFYPCYDTIVKVISVDSNSAVSITATDTVICMGQAITFKGIYSGLGDTLVSWGFGDGNATVGMDPIIHSFEQEGLFTVNLNVKYRSCPEHSNTRTVRVFALPGIYLGPDQAICPGGEAIKLTDDRNDENPKAKWKWNTGESSPSITVVKPGYYSALVSVDGCTASDTVWVQRDCYMDIPNVFSPNGDGTNDNFFPRQMLTRGVVTFKMEIYNRWGQLIYETTSTDGRGWDGQFNGTNQPQGVYVYRIEAKFKDGQIEQRQGNVTLLR
ncbi:MAG: Microbial collagenase precursor [Flavipsychrobacter sp.]|jgi:gliding motility-associated-like protein|nr:Microbial collagenase precursor [Flavipsychrobacter sp.]